MFSYSRQTNIMYRLHRHYNMWTSCHGYFDDGNSVVIIHYEMIMLH